MNKIITTLAIAAALVALNPSSWANESKVASENKQQIVDQDKNTCVTKKENCCKTEKTKSDNCCACCSGAGCAAKLDKHCCG